MRQILTLLATLLGVAFLAEEQPGPVSALVSDDILQLSIPTRRVLPDDVVQDSIELIRFPQMKSTAVRFTYTEAGAQKMLAFKEVHAGQKVRLVIGKFEMQTHLAKLGVLPPGITNYAQWKEGWLQRRTDKVFVRSEQDAQKILEGLKRK